MNGTRPQIKDKRILDAILASAEKYARSGRIDKIADLLTVNELPRKILEKIEEELIKGMNAISWDNPEKIADLLLERKLSRKVFIEGIEILGERKNFKGLINLLMNGELDRSTRQIIEKAILKLTGINTQFQNKGEMIDEVYSGNYPGRLYCWARDLAKDGTKNEKKAFKKLVNKFARKIIEILKRDHEKGQMIIERAINLFMVNNGAEYRLDNEILQEIEELLMEGILRFLNGKDSSVYYTKEGFNPNPSEWDTHIARGEFWDMIWKQALKKLWKRELGKMNETTASERNPLARNEILSKGKIKGPAKRPTAVRGKRTIKT